MVPWRLSAIGSVLSHTCAWEGSLSDRYDRGDLESQAWSCGKVPWWLHAALGVLSIPMSGKDLCLTGTIGEVTNPRHRDMVWCSGGCPNQQCPLP